MKYVQAGDRKIGFFSDSNAETLERQLAAPPKEVKPPIYAEGSQPDFGTPNRKQRRAMRYK